MTPLRAVDRVVNVAPQVQVTVVSLYSGWIPVFTEQLPMIGGRRVVRAGCATGTGARAPVCQTVNHAPHAVIPAPAPHRTPHPRQPTARQPTARQPTARQEAPA